LSRRELHGRTGPLHLGLLLLLCSELGQWLPNRVLAQSLIPGIDEWAEATARSSAPKWGGPRVAFPNPESRPASVGRLDSVLWPLSVRLGPGVSLERARAVLTAGEDVLTLLHVTGWSATFGDGGEGGTLARDLYVTQQATQGAAAYLDATEPLWELDGARAFAVVDARVPENRVDTCTAQALSESLLYELDPAEAESVRRSSAAYLSWLITGDLGCDDEQNGRAEQPTLAALGSDSEGGRGAEWLVQLGHRQDLNRGTFLRDMWQFARQRTWEGTGLRASPDLIEVIAAALLDRGEQLENIAGELADQQGLSWLRAARREATGEKPLKRSAPKPWTELTWSGLPARLPMAMEVGLLGTQYALLTIDKPLQPGDRLRVWSHGEYGARWVLSLLALDGELHVVGRISAPPRKNPNSFATLEMLPGARQVLISITNLVDGIPDPDDGAPFQKANVALTVDRGSADQPPELASP
jgi:hypothetical protein